MPTVVDECLVGELARCFKEQRSLREASGLSPSKCLCDTSVLWDVLLCAWVNSQVGMSFVVDHSGRLFTAKKCSLRDLVSNGDVTWPVKSCVAMACSQAS